MRTTVDDIGPYALSLGIGILVVSIAVLVIANMTASSYYTATWNNLTVGATNVTNVPYYDHQLTGVTCYNCTNQNSSFGPGVNGTDYVWWSNGTIQMWSASYRVGCAGGLTNLKSCNYQFLAENATSVLNAGQSALVSFAGFFSIIAIVIVAVVILGLVFLLQRAGVGGTA